MSVLSNLEPESVFGFFEEITKIPHGSGNVGQISDYLAEFAEKRGIRCIQDSLKNIIMIKEAAPGYEKEPAVILQGHMDMVAVKKPDCDIDMKTEGLKIGVSGDLIYAEGTSLGGDDGIAVAYILALFDSDTIRHPRLEAVITVDEEVGMDGARGIDLSVLTGSRMINLDSEEEGIFLTSCAGGARVHCSLAVTGSQREGMAVEVTLGGLQGGHSGGEIHKERGNSNMLFGRLLGRLTEKLPVCLVEAEGGLADNAIPRQTRGVLLVREADTAQFNEILKAVETELQGELASRDPGFFLETGGFMPGTYTCVMEEDTKRLAAFLTALPNGVQAMSADMPGLVETSLNLGILRYEGGKLLAEFAVRSSVESAKYALIDRVAAVTRLAGGLSSSTGDYPGWKYRKNSPLRDKMVSVYEEMCGTSPRVEAIHAGLECGILGSKIPDLDCVSLGPDMSGIHTTEETLSIASVRRVWEYLVRLLERKDD